MSIEETIDRKNIHIKYKPTYFNMNSVRLLRESTTTTKKTESKIYFKESNMLPKDKGITFADQENVDEEEDDFVPLEKKKDSSDSESDESIAEESFEEDDDYDDNESEFSE
jgi:hypothetical protein